MWKGSGKQRAEDKPVEPLSDAVVPTARQRSAVLSTVSLTAHQGPHPGRHPTVLAVPLTRRPLLPGILLPVRVRDERLIAELEDMRGQGAAYVGAFLVRAGPSGRPPLGDPASGEPPPPPLEAASLHDVGTFAAVHHVARASCVTLSRRFFPDGAEF